MWNNRGAFSASSGLAATPWTVAPQQVQLICRSSSGSLPIWHYGLLVEGFGGPATVHYLDPRRGIIGDSIETISEGRSWEVVEILVGSDAVSALRRLQTLPTELRTRPYHPITWNCEHFARLIVSGDPVSHQVQFACLAGLGVLLLGSYWLPRAS